MQQLCNAGYECHQPATGKAAALTLATHLLAQHALPLWQAARSKVGAGEGGDTVQQHQPHSPLNDGGLERLHRVEGQREAHRQHRVL